MTIKTLSDKEQARQKLPVFFGSNDNFYHPIREVIVNARDVLQGIDNAKIEVTLFDDNKTVMIRDNGAGLPIDGETDGVENYKLLFLTLFSGTKMDEGTEDGGTNGCGNTVICYSSDYMEATVKRKGKIYNIAFENGGDILKPFSCLGDTTEQGTEIKFRLSDAVYTNTIFKPNEVEFIVEKICATSPNIKATFIYKDYKKVFTYASLENYFDKTIQDEKSIKNIVMNKETFADEYIDKDKNEKKIENTTIEIIFNNCENNIQHSFLNGIYLPKMGTIHEGVIEGLREVLNKFISNNGLYDKKEKQINKQDIEESISYVCSVLSTKVSFSNQTKFSTEKKLYKTNVKKYIQKFFESYCIENKDNIISLVNKILINKRSREKAEVNRSKARKELEEKITNVSNRPAKFVPCRSKNPKEIDFVVIEGDSSLNSVKLARDSKYTCIMPLKGKPINPFKCKLDELLNNEEVKALYRIMGCGILYHGKPVKGIPVYDDNNMLVNTLQIATDFDFDGFHIQCLLIGIIYTLSPDMIKNGRVYILYTPLYIIKTKSKVQYKNENTNELLAYSEEERNTIVKMLNDQHIKFSETRFKGLGGLPVSIMAKSLNKETRILRQITMQDIEESKKWLELFLSDEKAKDRKLFIEEYGKNYFDYSLFE